MSLTDTVFDSLYQKVFNISMKLGTKMPTTESPT